VLIEVSAVTQVGDFGLARWQPDGHCGVETRVIGTFGYVIIHLNSCFAVFEMIS